MNSLAEDLEEVGGDKTVRGFVRRARARAGVEPHEATCWFAYVEQDRPHFDQHMITLGRSPGDVLASAEVYAAARYAARRMGTGRWLMEVDGSEGVDPTYLVVVCREDEAGRTDLDGKEAA